MEISRVENYLVKIKNVTAKSNRNDFMQLSVASKKIGKVANIEAVAYLVTELRENLNIGKNITAKQIINISENIIDNWFWLNHADIKKCFNNAMQGEYGEIYDRMDIMVINKFLKLYEADLLAKIENERWKESKDFQKELLQQPEMEEVREKFKKIRLAVEAKMRESLRPRHFKTLYEFYESIEADPFEIEDILDKKSPEKKYVVSPEEYGKYIRTKLLWRINNNSILRTKEDLINQINIL